MREPSSRLVRIFNRSREGLGFGSHVAHKLGLDVRPRFAGVSLSAPDADTAWMVALQIAVGEYRSPGLTPEAGWDVVDVGANIGVFSLWAERLGANVTAYEPEPRTFASLVTNVAGRRISPRQAALVGEALPTVRLYLSELDSTRNTVTAKEIESGEPLRDFVDVPTVTLAEVVGSGCELLKLDCEGAEFEALLGADDDTLRRAQRIVLEFHRIAGSPDLIVDRLEAAGMDVDLLAENEAVGVLGARLGSPRSTS
jgi:FkbM family methyltransferase